MQAAKDTFLKTLAGRLATVNPVRTVTLDGAARPAVLALENETPMRAETELETFLLNWQAAAEVVPGQPLMRMECKLSYGSKGHGRFVAHRSRTHPDRHGLRTAGDLQAERAAKCDYTQTPASGAGDIHFLERCR